MTTTPDVHAPLEAYLLGGVGEFGMNMMALRTPGATLYIDAGVMFPGPSDYGVEVIVPDPEAVRAAVGPATALLLTHGHEDHLGGVPYIWDLIEGPVYGTPLTLALLERKLAGHGIDHAGRLIPLLPGAAIIVGDVRVEPIPVTHSIPDAVAFALHTDVGTVVHTGDFKLDHDPIDGHATDLDRLAALGQEGVLALFSDSTNATEPGQTGSERTVQTALADLCADADGGFFVTTFASSLHRLQVLVDVAEACGRAVAFLGRGLIQNVEVAERLGHIRIPPGLRIPETEVRHHPPGDVLCVVSGSQGEPLAALARLAGGTHRHAAIAEGDVVVFSARPIPGNQLAIGRAMNDLVRRGARVVDTGVAEVHVSGHGREDELARMISLVRPRYLVPIHGEYRYLAHHAALATAVSDGSIRPLLAENGHRLCFDTEHGWIDGSVEVGRRHIDSAGIGHVVDEVLRDRRRLASGGVVFTVMTRDAHTGHLAISPTVVTRGFVVDGHSEPILESMPRLLEEIGPSDHGALGEQVRSELQRMLRKGSGRRPMVVPVIMEI